MVCGVGGYSGGCIGYGGSNVPRPPLRSPTFALKLSGAARSRCRALRRVFAPLPSGVAPSKDDLSRTQHHRPPSRSPDPPLRPNAAPPSTSPANLPPPKSPLFSPRCTKLLDPPRSCLGPAATLCARHKGTAFRHRICIPLRLLSLPPIPARLAATPSFCLPHRAERSSLSSSVLFGRSVSMSPL